MRRTLSVLAVMLFLTALVYGQAQSGYDGDSFTGKLTKGDDKTGEITLTAEVSGQAQTFTGALDHIKLTMPDGTKKELKPSDFPPDAKLTVKFKKKQRDEGGKKVDYNHITNVEMNQ